MMISSDHAVRLAWWSGEGFRMSDYGYADQQAATQAWPVLNIGRSLLGRQPYTHLVEFDAGKPVDVKELEVAA